MEDYQTSWAPPAATITYFNSEHHPDPTSVSSQTPSSTTAFTASATNPVVSNISSDFQSSHHFWDKLADGAKAGIISTIVLIILIIIVFSAWYCCGCCGLRRRRARKQEIQNPRPDTDTVPLQNRQVTAMPPVATIDRMASTRTREAPPPQYAEVTPPQHTTISGGITHVREEEEGIISDGKTPLSEIPFEDVVLDHNYSHSPSESSARHFGDRHLGLGGDTTGHTNS